MWYIHGILDNKRNRWLMQHEWMNLKNSTLNERSQIQNNKYGVIPHLTELKELW
jgi:hypothetical protein